MTTALVQLRNTRAPHRVGDAGLYGWWSVPDLWCRCEPLLSANTTRLFSYYASIILLRTAYRTRPAVEWIFKRWMALDRLQADIEDGCDPLVGVAHSYQLQHGATDEVLVPVYFVRVKRSVWLGLAPNKKPIEHRRFRQNLSLATSSKVRISNLHQRCDVVPEDGHVRVAPPAQP